MPEKGGRRRTRRHNQYHRRRGATPEREHLPAVIIQGEPWQLAQPPAPEPESEEEFRRRFEDWVRDECLLSAYTPLIEASVVLRDGNQKLCLWLGDAVLMEGAEFVIDRDRLCDCEPRVEELSDAHNDLVDEIESLHREIADSWDREDTDVRAAIEFHEVAVALHNEAKEFTKDVETLIAPKQTSSPKKTAAIKFKFVRAVLIDVAVICIALFLATLLLRLLSKVLGFLDRIATPGVARDCLQLTGHVVACRMAGEPWAKALDPPEALVKRILDEVDRRTNSLLGTILWIIIYG